MTWKSLEGYTLAKAYKDKMAVLRDNAADAELFVEILYKKNKVLMAENTSLKEKLKEYEKST